MTNEDGRQQDSVLWMCQWTLAAGFFVVGMLKALVPAADLQALRLAAGAPAAVQRAAGIVEVVGALGVILPAATGILPRLTPVAAGCLSGVALLGAVMPGTAAGFGLAAPNLLLAAAAAFVAWSRVAWMPVTPLGLRSDARIDRELASAFLDFADRHFAGRTTQEGGRGSTRRSA